MQKNTRPNPEGAKPILVKSITLDPRCRVEIPGASIAYGVTTELKANTGCHTVHYLPDRDVYEVVFHRPGKQTPQVVRIPAAWCVEVPWTGTQLAFESDPIVLEALRPAPAQLPAKRLQGDQADAVA
jgi:hypothetical protein